MRPDPIGIIGGVNFFTYVDNNPINQIDPWGLKGGLLIPIRKLIKKNVSGQNIVGTYIEKTFNVPTSPYAIIVYDFLNPREAGIPSEIEMQYIRLWTQDQYQNKNDIMLDFLKPADDLIFDEKEKIERNLCP
jgi:uncharacterized protein RhaS with RHS repeats